MYHQKTKNGIKIHLKVTPNAVKSKICDIIDGEFGQKILRVRIAAVADNGKANKALLKFMAKEWGIAPSRIKILSGETSRIKTLLVPDNGYFK